MSNLYDDPLVAEVRDSRLVTIEYAGWENVLGSHGSFWLELVDDYVLAIPEQWSATAPTTLRHREKDWDAVVRTVFPSNGKWAPVVAKLQRGQFHPMIWRNGIASEFRGASDAHRVRTEDLSAATTRCVSFHRIQRSLLDVFEVVAPATKNAEAYGAAIKQTLALAAMEVETLLRAAYAANASSSAENSTINRWFGLVAPMRLREWALALRHFPEWGAISPFHEWTESCAPFWWTANNKLKHDESKAHLANLRAAITAVAAIRVLVEAQFGPGILELLPEAGLAAFDVEHRPKWTTDELYFAPRKGCSLTPIPALSLNPANAT